VSEVAVEYLVVGDGEQTLVRTEVEHQILEQGRQGPPGPAFGSGDLDMDNHAIVDAKVVGFHGEYDNGDSNSYAQVLLARAQKQKLRITEQCVVELVGAGAPVGHYQLRLVQNSVGGYRAIWQGLLPGRWLNTNVVPEVHKDPFGESILSLYWDGNQFTQSLAKVGAL
jgi:hypothetical protein